MPLYFPWLLLLLTTGLVVQRTLGGSYSGGCDSDGIIGTFGQTGADGVTVVTSLTITPANFTKNLVVSIDKNKSPDDGGVGIQVYLSLDDDSECTDLSEFKLNFSITSQQFTTTKKCNFVYSWNVKDGKLFLASPAPESIVDNDAAFQASFEVRKSNDNKFTMYFNDPSGIEYMVNQAADECFDASPESIVSFTFQVDSPAQDKDRECGVQYEMKGPYVPTKMTIDGVNCTMVDKPGESNQDIAVPTIYVPTPAADSDSEGTSFPLWGYIVIGVGAFLILLLCIGLIIFFAFCCKKSKQEDDVEGMPVMPESNEEEGAAAATAIEATTPAASTAKESTDAVTAQESAPADKSAEKKSQKSSDADDQDKDDSADEDDSAAKGE